MSALTGILKVVSERIGSAIGRSPALISPLLQYGKNIEHGDLSLPLEQLARLLQPSSTSTPTSNSNSTSTSIPTQTQQQQISWLTQTLPQHLSSCSPQISQVYVQDLFLNIRLNRASFISQVLNQIMKEKSDFGSSSLGNKKKVLVEFSSPNIAKPFHAGHLRSTIIGNVTSNLLRKIGYDVVCINYLGDWGTQYGLLAVGFEKYGSEESLKKHPIQHLFNVYVQITTDSKNDETIFQSARSYFNKMEKGDHDALELWKKFRELSIKEYERMYAKLGVKFDIYSGESIAQQGVKDIMFLLEEKGLIVQKEKAKAIDLSQYNLGSAVLEKSDGSTVYISRDIAMAANRYSEYKFDEMIYVTGFEQSHHFNQLFKILELSNFQWASKCIHVPFGKVQGMATRKGDVVFLEDILEEASSQMKQIMLQGDKQWEEEELNQISSIVGLSAIIVQDLQAKRIKGYKFDWARMTDARGDTGVYLQYTHARLSSIERVALQNGISVNEDVSPESIEKVLDEKIFFDLVMQLAILPNVIESAAKRHEPSLLVNYLMKLARSVNSNLHSLRVKDQPKDYAETRLVFLKSIREALGIGIRILGLPPLDRM